MTGSRISDLSKDRPFPGLRPFDFDDHEFFFGRDDQKFSLYRLINRNRFVAVVGSSGSGKSSLVRAGLLPLIVQDTDEEGGLAWSVVTIHPGKSPLAELAHGLTTLSDGSEEIATRIALHLDDSRLGIVKALDEIAALSKRKLLLVVDQFEELFRYAEPGVFEARGPRDEPDEFVKLLLEASRSDARNVHVLLTMRSDFIGDCSRFLELSEAVSASQFLVPSPTRNQLEEAIRGPIEKAGATIDPTLVERLLNDVGNDLDRLPVLQHCLRRLWERAGADLPQVATGNAAGETRRHLTERHYRDIGGMDEALSQHADEIFQRAGPSLVVERIFRALAEVDKQRRAIRRAIPFAQLCAETGESEPVVRAAVDRFREDDCSFLIPSKSAQPELKPETQIDVGHEALLRGWKRVSGGAEAIQRPKAVDEALRTQTGVGKWPEWLKTCRAALLRVWGRWSGRTEAARRELAEIGWLRAEARDGERYRWLRSWIDDYPGRKLPLNITDERARWWTERRVTPAWTDRYGGGFNDVDRLIKASLKRKKRSVWLIASASAGMLLLASSWAVDRAGTQLAGRRNFELAVRSAQTLLDQLRKSLDHGDVNVQGADDLLAIANAIVGQVTSNERTPDNIALLANLQWTASDIYGALGKLNEAYDNAKSARDDVEPLYAKDPNNPKVLALMYNSIWRMADAIADRDLDPGTMERALGLYQEAETFARRLDEVQPGPRAQRNIMFVLQKIGDIRQGQGLWDQAIATYLQALTIIRQVSDADPANREWKRDLANTLSRLGQAFSGNNDFGRAMEYFDAALKIRKGLADLDKSDDVLQSNLATSYREIGRLYERRGDLDAAIEQYGTAIGIRDLLLQKDPANATWQVSLAPLYTELGAIYRRKGELSQALAQYRKAYQLRRQIAQRDLSIAARQRAYANTGMAIADLLLRLNQDLDDAESFYRGAIETLDEFRPRYDQDVFLCYVGVGDVLKARAEIDAALADYRRAAAIAEEAVTKGAASGTTSVPWVRNLRTAYFRTGELLIDQGHKEKAIEHYQKSLEFMQRTRYPENAGWSALLQALETEITKLKT